MYYKLSYEVTSGSGDAEYINTGSGDLLGERVSELLVQYHASSRSLHHRRLCGWNSRFLFYDRQLITINRCAEISGTSGNTWILIRTIEGVIAWKYSHANHFH